MILHVEADRTLKKTRAKIGTLRPASRPSVMARQLHDISVLPYLGKARPIIVTTGGRRSRVPDKGEPTKGGGRPATKTLPGAEGVGQRWRTHGNQGPARDGCGMEMESVWQQRGRQRKRVSLNTSTTTGGCWTGSGPKAHCQVRSSAWVHRAATRLATKRDYPLSGTNPSETA